MIVLRRTDSSDQAFVSLTDELSRMLAELNGEADEFFNQFSQLDSIPYVVIAEIDGVAVGCGSIRPKDETRIEVKRMFTSPTARGKGVGKAVLRELESWASELGYPEIILETMGKLTPAMSLYQGSGYRQIPNFPPYDISPESVCFAKTLSPEIMT